ncbi:uridine kinase [Alkalibaculum bacchi]|uniref:Uridine kinase n=1 Tax=Alkalibaculum bacchi TaxID=645887 RepID=A0A366I7Q6_9FIRM|nr:nucleoside kinase [Alkalibaculum bacchi]RBP63276.1 uridine kinase [Alkalibaculum bacchi]
MEQCITITVQDKQYQVNNGTPVAEFIQRLDSNNPIMGVSIDNRVQDLNFLLTKDCKLDLIDLSSPLGVKIYEKSLLFVLIKAAKIVLPQEELSIEHSLGGGIYCQFKGNKRLKKYEVDKIASIVDKIIKADLPINRVTCNKEEAIKKLPQKKDLFEYINGNHICIYELDGLYGYFNGYMLPSTGYLKQFYLRYYYPGFVLLYPKTNNQKVVKFEDQKKLFHVFSDYQKWCKFLDVQDVVSLNRKIADNDIVELIRVAEARHARDLMNISNEIASNPDRAKLIVLAGPSSAGKTTTSKRLATNLMVHGLRPVTIELDNYFLDRDKTPKNSRGEYDFDSINALDIELFNENLLQLLEYKEVEIPKYNFITGKRERGSKIKIAKDNPIIVEGIHGLNEKLTHYIPKENKYKIYLNALTHLNIDSYNRIPTTDIRLIRRLIRDYNTRGHNGESTLTMWRSVREGEEINIFPYGEEADYIFNSALLYEISVMRNYALPILKEVREDSPMYIHAERIIGFLELFLPIDNTSKILGNSIIREFIGGSVYD